MKNIDYLSADLNSPRAMVKINMKAINLPDSSFDLTTSIHVLDDIDDDKKKALSELYRILKPNGWSIHLVPVNKNLNKTLENDNNLEIETPKQRLHKYGAYANYRVYGNDYKDRLIKTGFKVDVIKCEDFCKTDEIQKYGLRANHEIYLMTKN